jgi:Subtilase family
VNRFVAGLALWLAAAGCASAVSAAEPPDPGHQILVMFQMTPQHFRPGTSYAGAYGDVVGRSARRRVAAQLAREHGLGMANDWPMPALGIDCFVMNVPSGHDAERGALVSALGNDPRVAWAQPMNVFHAQGHEDPLFAIQPAASAWHLAELHRVATGRRVRVAIVDSGVELSHPDLAGQIETSENFVAGRPFVAESHGTEIAGIIAARADNHLGIVGVAPGARLLALRACWQDSAFATLCTSLALARALDWAVANDAQIINMSLSGPTDPLLGKLIDVATDRGMAVVAAVDKSLPGGGFPADHRRVVAVAAEGPGPPPAGVLAAPGSDVPTTAPPSRWNVVSGSSYAAAHVSGLLALLRDGGGAGNADSVARFPTGAIDACATLTRRFGPCICACAVTRAAATTKLP